MFFLFSILLINEFVSILETLRFLYRNKVFLILKQSVSKGETNMNKIP